MTLTRARPAAMDPMMNRSFYRSAMVTSAALCAMLMSSCTIQPDPLTPLEKVARAHADRAAIEKNYVPLTGRLSLAEAIARALKYNYDVQLSQAEITLQEKQLDLAMAQMLPRLAAGAGYNWRSIPNAAESINVVTREQSLAWSYSEEPTHGTLDLTLTWNALDLGVSYFEAKQQGWRQLISVERRRKVIARIIEQTTAAYWRAAAAAELLPKIDPLLAEARRILDTSKHVGERHLQSPLALLDFQQNMIIVLGELEKIRNELSAASIELAALINVPQGQKLQFGTTLNELRPAPVAENHKLEEIGLALRPELNIESYQQKIDRQDIYKEILKMLPGVGILTGLNYDSNNLLYRNIWGELGVRATFNLFNLVKGPRAIAVAQQEVALDEQRRLALSVAVLSQINLSIQEYANALDNYGTARRVDAVGQQIATVANDVTVAGVQSEADRIRRHLTVVSTRITRDRALSRVHIALASMYSAVGADLVPAGAEFDDLPTLINNVETAIAGWQQGRLPELPPAMAAAAPAGPASAVSPH